MFVASVPSDPITLLAALFTLFGLPLIIFSAVVLYAGLVRRDADQALEEMEGELEADHGTNAAESRSGGETSGPPVDGEASEPRPDDASEPNADR